MDPHRTEGAGRWAYLGEAIRHGRRRTGMSQEELASSAQLDRKTIGNYERGRVPSFGQRIPDGYYQVAEVLLWAPEDVQRLLDGSPPRNTKVLMAVLVANRRKLDLAPVGKSGLDHEKEEMDARIYLLRWELSKAGEVAEASSLDEPLAQPYQREVMPGPAPASGSVDDPLALFPMVSRFGQACVLRGADPLLRDQLLFAAHELLGQVSAAGQREDYGMAAYRPHGWAEGDPGVPEDDAARIRKAVEEHNRNR